MLSLTKLDEIARRSQTSLLNIAREYIQNLFLSAFYQQEEAGKIYFKGGTALRLIYGSPRFSEDLDFSASISNCDIFEDVLGEVLVFLEKVGLKVELVESKPTTGGCLAIFATKIENLPVSIPLQVSLREGDLEGEAFLVSNPFVPEYEVNALSESTLAAEKIEALLTRGKPRDFFDLYFMLRKRMAVGITEKQREAVFEQLKQLDKGEVRKDVEPFLPKGYRLVIRDLPSALERELRRS